MLRNIIWDVDGTLFDTYPAIARAFRAALNDLGQDAPLQLIQNLARESLGHCASVLTEKYHLEIEDFGQSFEQRYSQVTAGENLPFPGVIHVCQYICSLEGLNVVVTHRGRKGTLELLAANHMTGYFAGCLSREDGYPRKPDPAIFEAAIAAHHLNREETLTVGDRAIDIQAGNAAGIFTCFYGFEAESAGADLVINNFDDLYQYLQGDK